ncbi:DUF418 domain-containing protein [Aquipuribacter hungaricus]|uniref:DUF418 domain-containing protein n=1 Tax=Aquipuribacter hungaricus TaxID=545624 RepID=A0ABV7WGN5_9MICO
MTAPLPDGRLLDRDDPPRPAPRTTPRPVPAAGRVVALDVLRGIAVCGILLVNAGSVTGFATETDLAAGSLSDPGGWLQLLVQQRFFPVFALLFGAGSTLVLAAARRRGATHPRVVLLRRLLLLLPLGVAHQLLHPGEALAPYAVVGLVVLLPSTWLPRWAVAAGAAGAVPTALAAGGGIVLVPGMVLLGSALVRYGVVDRLDRPSRLPVLLCAVLAAAAVPALVLQLQDLPASGSSTSSAVAGLLLAGVWTTGVVALLATGLRGVLVTAFAPLGRTALTAYVGATPLLLLAGNELELRASTSWTPLLVLVLVVLVVQAVAATLWLRRFRQGPLEWLWRWGTWGARPPVRVSTA